MSYLVSKVIEAKREALTIWCVVDYVDIIFIFKVFFFIDFYFL